MVKFRKRRRALNLDQAGKILLAAVFLFWSAVVWQNARGLPELPPGDFQRDTAITLNLLKGNFLKDHAYLGEYAGYPYLPDAVYAFFHKLTKIPVETLFLSYPQVVTFPAAFLFIFSFWKIFKRPWVVATAFFALIFIMPQTANHMSNIAHPYDLALGFFALAIYLFWRAISSGKKIDYLLAGLGIALVVYSEPFVAFTLCGGITLYQLLTRRHWLNFFTMVAVSFLLASPFIFPLVFVYKLRTINTLLCPFVERELSLDWLLYGYAPVRLFNCFLILSGLSLAFFRKNKLDRFLLSMFFFSYFFVAWGLLTSQVQNLVRFAPPKSIVWQDIGETNQFVAIFFLVTGLGYWLKELSLRFRSVCNPRKTTLALFLAVFGAYGLLMGPRFVQKVRGWYPSQQIYFPYDSDWRAATAWIKEKTDINDVFLAHSGPSYLFIGGMTGRKVVVTDDHHSNAFVNQQERVNDHWQMFRTTEMSTFLELAKKYQVGYVVISPYEELFAGAGLRKFLSEAVFRPVFSSGPVAIFELKEPK